MTNIPQLAVVETDGGRIRTREIEHGSGTHQPAWKESKTALFMRMASETHEHDPATEPPDSLQNRGYVGKLVRQMAGASASECDVAADDPREIVRRSAGYLHNNGERMDYPRYRREGLPMTSTLMESLNKEMNYRVKGSEKFWNNPAGANHILALKAAALSEDNRLKPHR